MMEIKQFIFNFISVNTYVLYDETGEAVIIDCGCFEKEEQETLKDFVSDKGLTIKHLLNTHLHLDHAFGNVFASQAFGLKPEGHILEEEKVPGLQQQAARFGIRLNDDTVPFGNYLEDGNTVTFGNNTLQCLLVPGHSPGSLCFYSKEKDCVFTGDSLFQGSIGRTDLWAGNFNVLVQAIRSKLLTLPDHTTVYPGHGPASTIGDEKKFNQYLR